LNHIEDRDSLAKPLQRHLANLFQLCGIFDGRGDTAADQDLPVLGLAA
jgi:hypothetical protein